MKMADKITVGIVQSESGFYESSGVIKPSPLLSRRRTGRKTRRVWRNIGWQVIGEMARCSALELQTDEEFFAHCRNSVIVPGAETRNSSESRQNGVI